MATSAEIIRTKLGIEKLTDFQQQAINALSEKRDVFVGTKTGSGKTVIYEGIGILNESVTVVLAPLQSIMEEQVERLNKLNISAIYIKSSQMHVNDVIAGKYTFIYRSPEILIDTIKWRDLFRHPLFARKLGLIVVDEAHTSLQW